MAPSLALRPYWRRHRSSSGPAVPDYYAAGVVVEGHLASSTWGVVDEVPPCPCRRQAIFAARRLRGGGYLLVGRILHVQRPQRTSSCVQKHEQVLVAYGASASRIDKDLALLFAYLLAEPAGLLGPVVGHLPAMVAPGVNGKSERPHGKQLRRGFATSSYRSLRTQVLKPQGHSCRGREGANK